MAGRIDNEAEYEAVAKKDEGRPEDIPWTDSFNMSGLNYSGSGPYATYNPETGFASDGSRVTSDMLARMDKDAFQPACFRACFVE